MEEASCGSRSLISAKASGWRRHGSSEDCYGIALHTRDYSPYCHIVSLAEW